MNNNITTLRQLENKVKEMGIKPGKYYILPKRMIMEFMYVFIQKVSNKWEVGISERADVHSVQKFDNFSDAVDRFLLLIKYT